MKIIEDQVFPNERDLYGEKQLYLKRCVFAGPEDGESALKEASGIKLEDCLLDLRYPLWHDHGVELERVRMSETCRAPLWYSDGITIDRSQLFGVKALRECERVKIENSKIVSPEFGWRSRGVLMKDTHIEGEYLFLNASDVCLKNVDFKGKYSFQYVENLIVEDSVLDTKDAFWHAKNVCVKNSVIDGEYLAWYSENLTLIDCKIRGTQPLCYCKGLKLENCEFTDADLSFEYSEVEADLRGRILSVKNPRSGRICADKIDEILLTADSKYPCECEIVERAK